MRERRAKPLSSGKGVFYFGRDMMKIHSELVHIGTCTDEKTGAITTPIYQSATFCHPELGQSTGYDYSRTKNPTRQVLEDGLAKLERGDRGFAFSSGLAALTTLFMLFQPGDHLVIVEDCYGGTYRLMKQIFERFGLKASFVDCTLLDNIEAVLLPETKAILVESPTNPLMKVADLRALGQLAEAKQLCLIVDNTFLTPYFQRPLELGAHIIVHSGTKYLSGHHDVLCGFLVSKGQELSDKIGYLQNATGAVLGPQEAWLVIRGLKTLALRMKEHQQNAVAVAKYLEAHPKVEHVYYPGLESHPGKGILDEQAFGYGGMLSFCVNDEKLVPLVLKRVKMIRFAESLGGVESLITFPSVQTHADLPKELRESIGVNNKLLRLSVGIEHVDDILADLEQALR